MNDLIHSWGARTARGTNSGATTASLAPEFDDARTRVPTKENGVEGQIIVGGEMGARVRAHDWSTTALGPLETWAPSWHTVVNLCLSSDFPMTITWGPELTQVYNDAYIPVLGAKHPQALHQTFNECWAEVWDVLGPMAVRAMATGEPSLRENLRMDINRYGYVEEAFFTYSFSPIRDETGRIAGLLHPVKEVTREVLAERRVRALRDLAARAGEAETADRACAVAAETLGQHAADLPFALIYLLEADGQRARLAGMAGLEATSSARRTLVELTAEEAPGAWPLGRAARSGAAVLVPELEAHFGPLPGGPWPESAREALVLPIRQPGSDVPAGLLVAGISPRRPLDDRYRGFVDLVAGQVATAIANARAYEAEKRRAEALAELDRAKTQFFSNVSHEFRTPLTLMLGPTEAALRHGASSGQPPVLAGDDLDMVHRNALRLLKLVNTMLDFSRIEAGRLQATYEPTDLAVYTAELTSNFRSAVERAGLCLVVDAPTLPADLPPVYVDRDMWEKVVLNLLSNALKHTFEGEIAVRVHARDGRAVVEVADTGVGIPPDQLAHVFVRFHRVPNARSRTHEGTGIGLALVQELVKLHGGTIQVESAVGRGSTFTITLPLGVAHLPADQLGTSPGRDRELAPERASRTTATAAYIEEALRWLPDAESTREERAGPDGASTAGVMVTPATGVWAVARAGVRILVADDNADMREYVTRLLRERGWAAEAVADGAAALASARARTPDLVLSDVMMPGLDGFALLDALRRDPDTRAVPVVLLSARAGEEARVEGVAAGAADYLVKPFSARELVARVEGHLMAHLERVRAAVEERRAVADRQADDERERARLRDLFAQAPAAIAVLRGPAHVYEISNRYYQRFVGDRDVLGQPVRVALPELAGQGIYELLDRVYATGEPYVGEGLRTLLDNDGDGVPEEHFFTFVYQPIRERDGSVSGVFVHGVDVTEQVRARRAAEEANQAKSDFLAAMSHELRTPLNAIGGYVQLIDMELHGPVTDGQHQALARVQRSQERLLSLINDVLNFAKLEAGRVEYELADVVLAEVVSGVVPMVEPQLAAKAISCAVHVDPAISVRADREKLEQVLLNLLSNAVKFTEAGGRCTVETAAAEGGRDDVAANVVYLHVSDTGIGIPADKLETIFDPFVQVHTSRAGTRGGTGLGLAISRDLARGMGGDLRVRSAEGEGSTFTVTLRRVVATGEVWKDHRSVEERSDTDTGTEPE